MIITNELLADIVVGVVLVAGLPVQGEQEEHRPGIKQIKLSSEVTIPNYFVLPWSSISP